MTDRAAGSNFAATFWATSTQRQLLTAALADGDLARRAWQEWRAAVDFDRLEQASLRLTPVLRTNLLRLGIADPLLDQMKDTQRRTWFRNKQLLRRLASAVATLNAGQIDVIILKGMALALRVYPNVGQRAMGDLDILIRSADWMRAVALLDAAGWRPVQNVTDPVGAGIHAVGLLDADRLELDLHCSPLHECLDPGAIDRFWQNAEPLDIEGIPALTLCNADMLLHSIAHGLRVNEEAPIRWLVDSVMILAADPKFDWDRLTTMAQYFDLGLPVQVGLSVIAELRPDLVPAAILARFSDRRVSLIERVEWRARRRQGAQHVGVRLGNFVRMTRQLSLGRRLLWLPNYLRGLFQTDSMAKALGIAIGRGVRAMFRAF